MEDKYYIPKIEDLHVGYECELELPITHMFDEYKWKSVILNEADNFNFESPAFVYTCLSCERLRTLYLTKEQIEAEGWEYLEHEDKNWLEFRRSKKRLGISPIDDAYFMVIYTPSVTKLLVVMRYISTGEEEAYYDGECKSVNEFRKILGYLGI